VSQMHYNVTQRTSPPTPLLSGVEGSFAIRIAAMCHCSMDEDHSAFTSLHSDEELSCRRNLSRGAHNAVLLLFLRSYQWRRFLVTFDLQKSQKKTGQTELCVTNAIHCHTNSSLSFAKERARVRSAETSSRSHPASYCP
jgi:hypothetical protein